jgi:hypothetical protein
MRLLHTSTFNLESFSSDNQTPPYAILSHTWGEEEVTLQELGSSAALLVSLKSQFVQGESLLDVPVVKKRFTKNIGCVIQAEKDGLFYIWIDTCCIDKTNSTELSEAINSMYY